MRKLAIGCGAYAAAIFLANLLIPYQWLLPLALILVLPGIALILLRRRWLLPLILVLCCFAAGLYHFSLHRMLTLEKAHAFEEKTEWASAEVLTVPVSEYGYCRADIMMNIRGCRLKTILYDRSGALDLAKPGDHLEGNYRFSSSDERYGESYDSHIARGVYLTANSSGELSLHRALSFRPSAYASMLNHMIADRIKAVFPTDTAPFFRALLLGEKTDLYRDDAMSLSLSRSGLIHIVAVSGMHVAFLIGVLRHLFGNMRRSALLSILIVWCFVFLTGASPSALRAGTMQTIVLTAPLLKRENDPPTSLLFALSVILLANPFAAVSISLQLSFAALAGILLFSDRIRQGINTVFPGFLPFRLKNYLSSTIANSFSVLVFSVPLMGFHFGYVSVLSPLTNLLTLWAVPLCFGVGYLCCLLSLFSIPAAGLLSRVISWPARFILWVAKQISSADFSCLYLNLDIAVAWVILVYVLFIAAVLLFRAGWKRWVFPALLSTFLFFSMLIGVKLYYRSAPGFMTAIDVGQGQSLSVFAGPDTVVVDCGNIFSHEDAGDLTGQYLFSRGRDRIQLLILTHLHADHADGVLRLMEYMPVDVILLGPDMEDPNQYLPLLEDAAAKHGTRIESIHTDETRSLGEICIRLFVPGSSEGINERCLTATISIGDEDMLVTGDINAEAEQELIRQHDLRDLEILIVSHHGSKYASSEELLTSIGAKTAIISCGYNTYGHPTAETLDRLQLCGYTVYRTDRDGTVELRLP